MKERREYVALMDVPSNVMILVEKEQGSRGGREKKKDEMDG